MGPLRLADEVGLDVALHVAADLTARLPHLPAPDPLLARLVAAKHLGKKSGRGFYQHPSGKPADLGIPSVTPLSAADYQNRIILVQLNEAARCLAERIVAAPEDVDFAMILGTGWAPFRGGPLRYADSLGITDVVARLAILARDVAPHFTPCDHLRAMTHDNRTFYSER
jgi:3-hydroxyacyl-CoA dehydrogenase/enoyl-CoA hydratase/3-hydroxybutyryl-CoA epimerase